MSTFSSSRIQCEMAHPGRVVVRTLGGFSAQLRNGCEAAWKGGGAGAEQLRKSLALLVSHRGHPLQHDDLRIVSDCKSTRSTYLSSAIGSMLKGWDMREALQKTRTWICLRNHESWCTDTDDLVGFYEQAMHKQEQGNQEHAILLLQQAEVLCNGIYLPGYMPPAEFEISDQRRDWMAYQKQALHALARLALRMPSLTDGLLIAQRSVQRVLDMDKHHRSAADEELAADLATQLHQAHMADHYTQQARQKRNH